MTPVARIRADLEASAAQAETLYRAGRVLEAEEHAAHAEGLAALLTMLSPPEPPGPRYFDQTSAGTVPAGKGEGW